MEVIAGGHHLKPLSRLRLCPNAGWSQKTSFSQVDRHEIVKDKSVEELNAQLVSLVGENGAELLVVAIRSRRSISGYDLTG